MSSYTIKMLAMAKKWRELAIAYADIGLNKSARRCKAQARRVLAKIKSTRNAESKSQ